MSKIRESLVLVKAGETGCRIKVGEGEQCCNANKFVSWQDDFQDGCVRTNDCASLDWSKEW